MVSDVTPGMRHHRWRLLYSRKCARNSIQWTSSPERESVDARSHSNPRKIKQKTHVQGNIYQTSAQPPSSSLYDASLSGLSGLSTSFATRSSARPKTEGKERAISLTTVPPLRKGMGYWCICFKDCIRHDVSQLTFTEEHPSCRRVRENMSSNRFESSTSHEGHSSSGIGFIVIAVGKNEQMKKKGWEVRKREHNKHWTWLVRSTAT